MDSNKLLEKAIKMLINEALSRDTVEPFSFSEKLMPLKPGHVPGFIVYRTFKMHVPEEIVERLEIGPDEFIDDDVAEFEHEIELDVIGTWRGKHYASTRTQPASNPEFDVDDVSVVSIDGFRVGPRDAQALEAYVGELTPDEREDIEQRNEPDAYDYDREPYEY